MGIFKLGCDLENKEGLLGHSKSGRGERMKQSKGSSIFMKETSQREGRSRKSAQTTSGPGASSGPSGWGEASANVQTGAGIRRHCAQLLTLASLYGMDGKKKD